MRELITWHPHLTDLDKLSLANLERFKEICKGMKSTDEMEKAHYVDAFSLWTAEVHEFNYYLTVDGKFRRYIQETIKSEKLTEVVQPLDLIAKLNVTDLEPLPILDDNPRVFLG